MKYLHLHTISLYIATLAGIGTLPYAPGTYATLITMCCICFLSLFPISLVTHIKIICCTLICACITIFLALPLFENKNDPSAIVIDEVAGTLITFLGITLTWKRLCLGFILFRFFDIIKPAGIQRLERIEGALGIIADDVIAGLYANALLQIYSRFFI